MILAVDLGGTNIKLGLVDADVVVAMAHLPAKAQAGLAAQLPLIEAQLEGLCAEAGLKREAVEGIGMGFPCLIDRARRRITSTIDKYSDATKVDLPRWSREALGLPLLIDNDAVAAMVGEWQYGAGGRANNVAMLILGTGVGSAVVLEGRVVRGSHDAAGILFGHNTVDLNGERCICGNVGCVEAVASTWAVQRRWGPEADLAWLFADGEDPERGAQRSHVLRVWGAALVNLVHAFDPERIVVGGGAMGSRDKILPEMTAYVSEHAWRPSHAEPLSIVPARLGDAAALVGLGWLFREDHASE